MEQRDNSEVNMFALYVVGISSIPGTAYGSLSTALENRGKKQRQKVPENH